MPLRPVLLTPIIMMLATALAAQVQASPAKVQNADLIAEASQSDGTYSIRSTANNSGLTARFGAKINGKWVFSTQYPRHKTVFSQSSDDLGQIPQIEMTNSGLFGEPDLILYLRLHHNPSYVEIQVEVPNNASSPITVEGIRLLEANNSPAVSLGPSELSERVLSDSWSEDRPSMRIRDLADAPNSVHRGVGSQLIYNLDAKRAVLAAALTSDKWLTVLRLRTSPNEAKTVAYEIDSTGTTELTRENSLAHSIPEDQIELSLPVEPGQSLSSERVMLTFGSDCNALLEAYGDLMRRMHHARVGAPTPIGWWSWTAYYFGLTEGSALTNANFLAHRLRDKGYQFFHIDEGYQYARGEYAATNGGKFPHGLQSLERTVQNLGLTPGLWTAPFEVSERSWVYLNHKDWLVHNRTGAPIQAGRVSEDRETKKPLDLLYVLDPTNPGAQEYLRQTYSTLARQWGVSYIKLDFMEDSAVEGAYYRPHTTALEAQRIGLQVIRDTVGDDVLLDKDGSPMLNPVGLVDAGRISVDTGHSFEASKEAAPGIAARYYMNRNFFISDPDAFGISRQFLLDEPWHGGKRPLTDDEAHVSIALSAVSGGMFEIGDDLPTLFLDPQRMALLENRDLVNMAQLGRASRPTDLMTYAPEDGMPSTFFLRESKRQSVLTVFNWTDAVRHRRIGLQELGLSSGAHNQFIDVFASEPPVAQNGSAIDLNLPPHSVRMLKIIDTSVAAHAPVVTLRAPQETRPGIAAEFSAMPDGDSAPVIAYSWDFGDGTSAHESTVMHAFTHGGIFNVSLRVDGVDGAPFEKSFAVKVAGVSGTRFDPKDFQRVPSEK